MSYLISPLPVLLGRRGKRHGYFGLKISFCGGFRKDSASTAECDIFEAEWCDGDLDEIYSPGRTRKKYSTMIMSH